MIPSRLHFTWMGGGELPPLYREHLRKWRWMHPEWQVALWRNEDFGRYVQGSQDGPLTGDLFNHPPAHVHAGCFQSDVARLEILYRYGGVYLDLDMRPISQLDPLVEPALVGGWIGAQEAEDGSPCMATGAMAFRPGHPFVRLALEQLRYQFELVPVTCALLPLNNLTGPGLLDITLKTYRQRSTWPLAADEVAMLEPRCFYPYSWHTPAEQRDGSRGRYAEHLYHGAWAK